jgi:nucleoside-diphosphate-sugar epimerase
LVFVYIDVVISSVDYVRNELKDSPCGVHLKYSIRSYNPVTILDALKMMRSIVGINNKDRVVVGAKGYRDRERFKLYDFSLPTPPGWLPRIPLLEGLIMLIKDREANFLSGLNSTKNKI